MNKENNFQKLLNSLNNTNIRNNKSQIYLGYEEAISEEMYEFQKAIIGHYSTRQKCADFLQTNDKYWENLKVQLLRQDFKIKGISMEDQQLFGNIIRSHTFRAIISSFINFYMVRKHTDKKIKCLKEFYKLVAIYFMNDGVEDLLRAQKFENYHRTEFRPTLDSSIYMSRIKIIMKINIFSITVYARFDGKPYPLNPEKLFSIFQETILANTFDITSRLTSTFVTNLPGCGDCITIFKRIKKYFLFTECKLKRFEALVALRDLNNSKGINKGINDERGLIEKVDPTIRSRFLSSYVVNYCTYIPKSGSKAEQEHNKTHVFTVGLLERSLDTMEASENLFDILIPAYPNMQLLDNFVKVDIPSLGDLTSTFSLLGNKNLCFKRNMNARSFSQIPRIDFASGYTTWKDKFNTNITFNSFPKFMDQFAVLNHSEHQSKGKSKFSGQSALLNLSGQQSNQLVQFERPKKAVPFNMASAVPDRRQNSVVASGHVLGGPRKSNKKIYLKNFENIARGARGQKYWMNNNPLSFLNPIVNEFVSPPPGAAAASNPSEKQFSKKHLLANLVKDAAEFVPKPPGAAAASNPSAMFSVVTPSASKIYNKKSLFNTPQPPPPGAAAASHKNVQRPRPGSSQDMGEVAVNSGASKQFNNTLHHQINSDGMPQGVQDLLRKIRNPHANHP